MHKIWRNYIRFLSICFALLWGCYSLNALDPERAVTQYNIKIWNMESGLPSNTVYAVYQTRDGYLWIGTAGGLVRFDGIEFKSFTTENLPQLRSDVIRAIYQDRKERLWIGTSTGGVVCHEKGNWTSFPVSKYKSFEKISAIQEDRWGNIWFSSFEKGLTYIDTNGKVVPYSQNKELPLKDIRWLHRDSSGGVWALADGEILRLVSPGRFLVHNAQSDVPYKKIAALYKPLPDELWIGTVSKGLFRLREGKVKRYGTAQGIPQSLINILFQDRQGNLWIGLDGGGLSRLKDGRIDTLTPGEGLESGYVYSIHEDSEGNLWVGTIDGGLHQFRDGKFTTLTVREGLPHNDVNCVYEDRTGNLWAGTRGGLAGFKPGRPYKPFITLTKSNGLSDDNVLCLLEDSRGVLWIGAWGGGLQRYKDGQLLPFAAKNSLSNNIIRCLLEDGKGNLWAGTQEGLNRYNAEAEKFDVFSTGHGLKSNVVQYLFEDSKGRLWISTSEGVNRMENGEIRSVTLPPEFEGRGISTIYEDKEGVFWMGSENGLLRWSDGDFKLFTNRTGLVDNHVDSILEDDNGYLWLSGRGGMSRVHKQRFKEIIAGTISKLEPQWYNEKDGMKSRWNNFQAIKSRDGWFLFPTNVGIAMIHPGRIGANNQKPPLYLQRLVVDGEDISLERETGQSGELRLEPGKKRLEFYYSTVSFVNPQRIRFKSRLIPYDTHWIDMNTARSSTYTGLSPGRYTFRVMAVNPDGVWNREGISFSFYLRPYFYQTLLFYIAVAILFLVLSFSLYRFRVRSLRARQRELSRLVDERTRDLEERNVQLSKAHESLRASKEMIEDKNKLLQAQSEQLKELDEAKSLFFANLSHEFRTPLTLIMGPLEEMLSTLPGDELKHKSRLMLRNTRRLLNLVDQLLELAKFDSGKMKLQASRQNIVPFVENIVLYFEELSRQNSVALEYKPARSELTLYFDPEKLEKIITNLLSNAFNYTPHGGKVTVTLNEDFDCPDFPRGCLEITVKDTGRGIEQDQIPYIFDRFYRAASNHEYRRKGTGIGLALTKELMELHRGRIRVLSSTAEDENRGTSFILMLHLGTEHLEADEIVDKETEAEERAMLVGIAEAVETAEVNDNATIVNAEADEEEIPPLVLVVEDDRDMRAYIAYSLSFDFRVIEASDGKDGLERARAEVPDLIVSDVMMPVMDGYELCRNLKQDLITSHIPIILLTAKVSEESVVGGLETGADDYIGKPFNPIVLSVRVRNLIDLRRQLQLERRNRLSLKPGEIPVSPVDDEFYKRLKKIVESNVGESEFNVEAMAREFDMSQPSLYRKVQALTGKSPNEFIRSYRLKIAAQLLQSGEQNVAEIGSRVGFNDPSYFSRCFKKQFGCLPSHYQNMDPGGWGEETEESGPTDSSYDIQSEDDGAESGAPVILVVEDNPNTLQYIRQALETEYRVAVAVDGNEGVRAAMDIIPDLVITDVVMPGIDGFELCRILKNDVRTSHIPIIVLTARSADEDVIRGLETGADDYITKPFNTRVMHARIRNLIHLRTLLQSQRERELSLMPEKIEESDVDRKFVDEMNRCIDKHISEPRFSVDQLAGELFMSKATLYRKVQALTGETPSHYIRDYRLQKAAQLLKNQGGTVTEIAFEVGFNSRSYFTRCFKEKFHSSPTGYLSADSSKKQG